MHSCPDLIFTPVLSWHRVANGYVGYRRCPCGVWSIVSAPAPRFDAIASTDLVIPSAPIR